MTEPAPPLVRAVGVTRRFRRAVALDGVDVDVHAGESVAVLGPNGAGKTTLLRILAGVDRADRGAVERPQGAIGWVPQRPAVYPRLTVAENVAFFASMAPGGGPATTADVIESADLGGHADRRADQLSTGTLQRLNIATALVASPRVLLLDEPTATLSPDQRVRLWAWLTRLREDEGMTLMFATQSVGEASRHADRCLVIAHGAVRFDGSPADLAARTAGEADPHAAMQAAFMDLVHDTAEDVA